MVHNINRETKEWAQVFRDRCDLAAAISGTDTYLKSLRLHGDLPTLLDGSRKRIAIIGTRECLPLVKGYINSILSLFTDYPDDRKPVIISGLSVGTDTAVHRAALHYGLPTVAVITTGLDTVYPSQNSELAGRLTVTPGCGILTQFPDHTTPTGLNSLERNKTIALLSDIVIIPAARAKGEAIVAARVARDWDVPVYAVPGRPADPWSAGCNDLIREGLAQILYRYEDILQVGLSSLAAKSRVAPCRAASRRP